MPVPTLGGDGNDFVDGNRGDDTSRPGGTRSGGGSMKPSSPPDQHGQREQQAGADGPVIPVEHAEEEEDRTDQRDPASRLKQERVLSPQETGPMVAQALGCEFVRH